ncbi:hypothetical protein Tco_0168908 [Tanacetum coccineum]
MIRILTLKVLTTRVIFMIQFRLAVKDERIDAYGNSDVSSTTNTTLPWIIERGRLTSTKSKNIRHATPIHPAHLLLELHTLAQAPAPVRYKEKKSIFQITFKNPRKATHIPFVTTTVPPPPPPPPSWSLFSNCFTLRNKIKNIPSSKNSKLPPLPPTRPPPQPELQRQRYDQQSSICSSSESSCLPPPLPPLNMPEMKDKYYGNFVRLGSYNSNTSSSPDLQPMGQPPSFIKGLLGLWISVLGGNLKWELPTVNRQPSTWECGYYVMRWMHDFVLKYQNDDFPNTIPWGEERRLENKELDAVIGAWLLITTFSARLLNGLFFMVDICKTDANVMGVCFLEIGKSLPRTQPTQNPACMVLVKRPAEGAGSASCCSLKL